MIIDPTKSKIAAEFNHESPLLSCGFDSRGRFLFAGGRDRSVVVVDLASGKKSILAGHESWVGAISRANDGMVLTADHTGLVIAWNCSANEPKRQWSAEIHSSNIHELSVSADGQKFATCDRDGLVRIGRTSDGKCLHELPRIEHPVHGVAWFPDGLRLISADRQPRKPRIKVWEIATGKEQLTIEIAELSGYRRVEDIEWGGIRGVAVSSDGKEIVACGRLGYDGPATALLFDATTGKLLRKFASTLKGFYYSVTYHLQGFLISVGGDVAKGEIRCWNPRQDTSLADIPTLAPCTSLALHPDGKRFAVTQTAGKGTYPDAGKLVVHEWAI